MSTTRQIFNAYDLTTDNSATLEHRFTPWGSWHVTTYIDGHHKEVMHDWLPSAAEAITNALQTFKDDDAPTTEQALDAIVAMVGNPHYEVFDSGDGPFILDNEECDECDDEQETNP